MPTSKTEICNFALAHNAVDARIIDIDTEDSNEARHCRLFYDHSLKLILERRKWSFLSEQVTLTSLGSPPEGWAYRYNYPNYAIRINFIVNPVTRTPTVEQLIPYEIINRPETEDAGRAIATDQDDAIADINRYVTNPNLFTNTFVQAFSYVLASHISSPLRVNPDLAASIEAKASFWLTETSEQTLSEMEEGAENESEFSTFRG